MESDGESNGDDGEVQMHGGDDPRPLPSPNELKTLVKALIEYAEVLDWRVWRMQEEPGCKREQSSEGQRQDQGSWGIALERSLLRIFTDEQHDDAIMDGSASRT
jgi:hypothetical protein